MFRRGWRAYLVVIIFVVLTILYMGYICQNNFCSFSSTRHNDERESDGTISDISKLVPDTFPSQIVDREYQLDLDDEDVLVFLHIQKTGGTTFGRHLVKNLDVGKPCVCRKTMKKCECLTRKKTLWLFSRYSTGWACGLHADWTELKNCVDTAMDKQEGLHRERRYHYITILRDPVGRYLSEFKHVQRGATWKTARLFCNGRQATLEEVPFCYEGETWENVDLGNFLDCKYNLANNRQTRMLANLSKINCYNKTGLTDEERDQKMLESAIENLQNFSFFGLTEFQKDTQNLFEHTFNLKFIEDFEQHNATHRKRLPLTEEIMAKIKLYNNLDMQLYQFARELFQRRVEKMKDDLRLETEDSTNDQEIMALPGNT
ncbi:heparan-sulfate 6-O-sulfotransferase 1-like [Ylistrum balloti]|uniref:heparan-sulfate 6-O-sulfotransferase 1-like n=1 Tax=Ylistrum balloti TaxID=509963 RepID=UPI0029059351|nr:heparan-sulfate 6-O-sulfotransferase 1-like [Ylistrum balloti]